VEDDPNITLSAELAEILKFMEENRDRKRRQQERVASFEWEKHYNGVGVEDDSIEFGYFKNFLRDPHLHALEASG
jgi:hypothetical protein